MTCFIFVGPAECDNKFWIFVCVVFNLQYSVHLLNITIIVSQNTTKLYCTVFVYNV